MQDHNKYSALLTVILEGIDLVMLNALFFTLATFFPVVELDSIRYQVMPIVLNMGYLLSALLVDSRMDRRNTRFEKIVRNASIRVAATLVILVASLFLMKIVDVSRLFTGTFFASWLVLMILTHTVSKYVLTSVMRSSNVATNAIILGAGKLGHKLMSEISHNSFLGIKVLGFFDDKPGPGKDNILGNIASAKRFALDNKVQEIYCTLPVTAKEEILDMMEFADNNVMSFYIVPSIRYYADIPLILETIGNMPILSTRNVPLSYAHNYYFKRSFDIFFSVLFLVTLFPPMYIILGTIIKLTSKGPIFFKQKRTGEKGNDFYCYKFRSMRASTDADSKQANKGDSRITKIGAFMRKTSLDEFPQFINVLKGEMSIVGPRPHMLLHTSEYSKVVEKYMVRHFIKPGITGLAQITGYRGETESVELMDARIMRDIWYIEHWSIGLDIRIIFDTMLAVVKPDSRAY